MTTSPPAPSTGRWFHPVFTTVTVLFIAGVSAWAWIGRGKTAPARPDVTATPTLATPSATPPVPLAKPVAGPATDVGDPPGGLRVDPPVDPPAIAPEPQELHGVLRGERFWSRLQPSDKAFPGRRILQLVYTPPTVAELDGAQLIDCPFVLLDVGARVVAWNGRDGLSNVHPYRAKDGYRVVREVPHGEGELASPIAQERRIAGPMAYDLRLAPVLLALSWRAGSQGAVPVVDLFGPRFDERIQLRWNGADATLGAETWRIEADDAGRLRRIVGADGNAIIDVMGRS